MQTMPRADPKGKSAGWGERSVLVFSQYAEKFRNKISVNERHRLRFVNKQYEHYWQTVTKGSKRRAWKGGRKTYNIFIYSVKGKQWYARKTYKYIHQVKSFVSLW